MDRIGLPLGSFGPRSPYTLSGGEQRRLSLASALVRNPIGPRPRRADVRPGPARARGAARDPRRRTSATARPCSRRPTTSGSSRTFAGRIVRHGAGGRIVHVELAGAGSRPRRSSRDGGRVTDERRSSSGSSRARQQLASVLGRTSPLVKLAIALVWLVGPRAHDEAPAAGVHHDRRRRRRALAGRDPVGTRCSPASRRCGSRRSASACSTPCSRAPTRTRRCPSRSCSARSTSRGRRWPAGVGLAARVIAIAVRRRGVRPDDGLDPARRLARAAGRGSRSGSGTARWPRTRRSRGSPTRSRPCARPAGSAACGGAGTRGCWSGCWCSRSATATAWRWRWTRGRSGPGRGRATAWCAGRGWISRSRSGRSWCSWWPCGWADAARAWPPRSPSESLEHVPRRSDPLGRAM